MIYCFNDDTLIVGTVDKEKAFHSFKREQWNNKREAGRCRPFATMLNRKPCDHWNRPTIAFYLRWLPAPMLPTSQAEAQRQYGCLLAP